MSLSPLPKLSLVLLGAALVLGTGCPPTDTDKPDDSSSGLSDADNDGATYAAFGGGLRNNNMVDSRAVIVVGPDGRIAHTIKSFNQNDPMAYEELAEVIDRVTPEPEAN